MIIGGWNNTASVIRLDMNKGNDLAKVDSKNVVTKERFTTFYIQWAKKGLTVRMNGATGPILMQAENCVKFPVHFFAVRTAWGATGCWKIRQGAQIIGKAGKGKEVLGAVACKSVINRKCHAAAASKSIVTKYFLLIIFACYMPKGAY